LVRAGLAVDRRAATRSSEASIAGLSRLRRGILVKERV